MLTAERLRRVANLTAEQAAVVVHIALREMASAELREAHAPAVPVFVMAQGDDTWALVQTSDEVVLSTHDTAREALDAALEQESIAGSMKRANLRTEGTPDGEWRWLDATAEEDEAIDDVRIGVRTIWSMAAKLNVRASAPPIDGGKSPEGMMPSAVHGTAVDSGTPANGFAHVGVPVVDEGGRTHLFMRGELLPEIAAEFDRGRLAYGSVHFSFDEVDEDADFEALGAELRSHALTNDPAVTTLTAGSERGRGKNPARFVVRTKEMTMAKNKDARRGPAVDALARVAEVLGVEMSAEMDGETWESPILEAIHALKQAASAEAVVEAVNGGGAPAAEGGEDANAVGDTSEVAREVGGLEGAELEAAASDALDMMRAVLGKPDAAFSEALAEMVAMQDMLRDAAAAAGDGEGEGTPAENQDDENGARSRARGATALRARAEAAEARVAEFEARDWLDGQLRARKMDMPAERRAKLVSIAVRQGRDIVGELLEQVHVPPTGDSPMGASGAPTSGAAPKTISEAADSCMDEAREALKEHASKFPGASVPRHIVRGRAQRIARERFPSLFETPAAQTV